MKKQFLIAASLALAAWTGPAVNAAHYAVDSTFPGYEVDSTDMSDYGGSGTAGSPYLMHSLRGAVMRINSDGPGHTLHLPAGTYQLTLSGAEGFAGDHAVNDLDIAVSDTTIVGAGADVTIINQNVSDRVIEVNPGLSANFNYTLQRVKVTGGQSAYGGGGLICGSSGNTTTIQECVFENNEAIDPASAGGAIQCLGGGALIVEDCTFRNNSTDTSSGGAIDVLANPAPGSLSVVRSQFYGNASANSGGAINVAGTISSASQILLSSFDGNTASNQGGAVAVAASASGAGIGLNIERCRLADNSSPTPAVDNDLTVSGLLPVAANQNWWGQNDNPADAGIGDVVAVAPAVLAASSVDVSSWLQLGLVPGATSVAPGGSASLAADILGLNLGGTVDLSQLAAFPTSAATLFSSDALGSISGADGQFSGGAANATFDAGSNPGSAVVSVTVDNETITTTIDIPTSVLSIARADANPTSAASVGWTVIFAHAVSGVTAGNFALATADLDGAPAITAVAPVGGTPTDTWTVTASTGSVSSGACSGSLRLDMINDTGMSVLVGNLSPPFEGESYSIVVPPSPGSDTLGTRENVPVDAPIVKLLVNDSGSPVLSITAVSPTSAQGGTVSIVGDMVHYVPPLNYAGPDQFTYELTDGCGNTATGVVDVLVTDADAPSLNEVSLTDLGGGQLKVVFAGIPGQNYTIQYAPVITGPWTDVVTLTAGANGLIEHIDTPAATPAFYRTKATP